MHETKSLLFGVFRSPFAYFVVVAVANIKILFPPQNLLHNKFCFFFLLKDTKFMCRFCDKEKEKCARSKRKSTIRLGLILSFYWHWINDLFVRGCKVRFQMKQILFVCVWCERGNSSWRVFPSIFWRWRRHWRRQRRRKLDAKYVTSIWSAIGDKQKRRHLMTMRILFDCQLL